MDENSSLEELMDTCGLDVMHTAMFYMRDPQSAQDVFQEVFYRVWRWRDTFRGESSIKTWILRITVNVCQSALRKPFFRKEQAAGTDPWAEGWAFSAPKESEPEPDRLEERIALQQQLFCMPVKYREVLVLYYLEDLQVEEIAGILALPSGTVRTRLQRGKVRLLKAFAGKEDEEHER